MLLTDIDASDLLNGNLLVRPHGGSGAARFVDLRHFRRMSSILLWCVEWEEESLAWRGSRIYISLALRLLDLQCFTLIFPSWVLLGAIQDPLWTPPCRTFMQGRHKLSFLRSLTPVGAVAGRVIGSPSRERQVAASCLSSCSYPAFGRSPRWG